MLIYLGLGPHPAGPFSCSSVTDRSISEACPSAERMEVCPHAFLILPDLHHCDNCLLRKRCLVALPVYLSAAFCLRLEICNMLPESSLMRWERVVSFPQVCLEMLQKEPGTSEDTKHALGH